MRSRPAATLLLLAALLGAAAATGRRLAAPSPTEKLNADRQKQEAAAAAAKQAAAAAAPTKRLRPPCFVPTSWYPYQLCDVSQDATTCGRGYLAWSSLAECCAKQRGPLGAFPGGCTDMSKNVTCWVAGSYHPTQTCQPTTDLSICSRNWGRWASEADCCAPGAAHADGCTKSEPCWVATAWYPARACGQVKDDAVCQRGWGAFATEDDCCQPGAAHSEGCGPVGDAGVPQS
ncbi:hypothetical protein ABPG75_004781 [Micractinium tetrahymenae]